MWYHVWYHMHLPDSKRHLVWRLVHRLVDGVSRMDSQVVRGALEMAHRWLKSPYKVWLMIALAKVASLHSCQELLAKNFLTRTSWAPVCSNSKTTRQTKFTWRLVILSHNSDNALTQKDSGTPIEKSTNWLWLIAVCSVWHSMQSSLINSIFSFLFLFPLAFPFLFPFLFPSEYARESISRYAFATLAKSYFWLIISSDRRARQRRRHFPSVDILIAILMVIFH